MQLYLISIARDCGFIPSKTIDDLANEGNWNKIVKNLNILFNTEFMALKSRDSDIACGLYNETKYLPVRLDYLPPDCLGLAYEKLIREVKDGTRTSFYTPEELINKITDGLELKPSDKILDPTCGSGAFLISCIQKIDPENIKEYIEKRIFGYDNDWYACQIAKASLLAIYASLLPYDPKDISEKGLGIPQVNIECKDFFEVDYNTKYDVILGNPPWGIIDNPASVNPKYKSLLKNFAVYKDKSDVCIYIFEKSFNLLKANGRIGMVCKLQVTEGKQHSEFKEWIKGRISTIIDYGDLSLFHNGAQTAILIGKKTLSMSTINIIKKNQFPSIVFEHEKISKYFYISQGWQSAKNKIFKKYAKDYPNDEIVMSVAPGKKNMTFFSIDKKILEKIAVVIGNNVPQKFLNWLSKENKEELKNRAEIKRNKNKNPYSWLWTYMLDKYSFGNKQTRLIFPNAWSFERIPVTVDLEGKLIGLTSHTVMIPKPNTPKEIVFLTAAWISSKYFHSYARHPHRCKRLGNGGLSLLPEYIGKCSIPIADNINEIADLIKKLSKKKGGATANELENVNVLITEALMKIGIDKDLLTEIDRLPKCH